MSEAAVKQSPLAVPKTPVPQDTTSPLLSNRTEEEKDQIKQKAQAPLQRRPTGYAQFTAKMNLVRLPTTMDGRVLNRIQEISEKESSFKTSTSDMSPKSETLSSEVVSLSQA